MDADPSHRLAELCSVGVENMVEESLPEILPMVKEELDLAVETSPPSLVKYAPLFTTVHKGPVGAATFSPDGSLFATGSDDTSIKVLDVHRIETNSANGTPKVIRTLYDHTGPINDLAFHPNGLTLASCSSDCTIRLFDMSKENMRRGFRFFQDAYPVRSIAFHPSGDFILSGSDHQTVRIIDVHTLKTFIPNETESHSGPINRVAYAPSGSIYSSCSRDGSIKIYDTVSGKCVNTLEKAHGGASVSSIVFSSNSSYLLSTGLDSVPKLWDMKTGKVVVEYSGASQKQEWCKVVFNYNEKVVLGMDSHLDSVVLWDARTGVVMDKVSAHGQLVSIAASPSSSAFVTCGYSFFLS